MFDMYRYCCGWCGATPCPLLSGCTNSRGPVGPTGPTGARGLTGIPGPTGPQGPTGPTGATGPMGPAGPQGVTGAAGSVGPAGPQGATGATGAQGAMGPVGPTGATGPRGLTGIPGPTGAQGPTGPTGAAGLMGPTGPQGATGATGPIGPTGPQGALGEPGPTGPQGEAGPTGATGSTGPIGPTGPTGSSAVLPDDIFASFIGSSELFTNGSQVLMFPAVTDPTGNITEQDLMHIQLEAGYYLVSYSVSAIFNDPSYMQITPFYNGMSHLETGVYFATAADGSSACGSSHFILVATAPTTFSLTYSGPIDAREGTVTLTFLKLRRTL